MSRYVSQSPCFARLICKQVNHSGITTIEEVHYFFTVEASNASERDVHLAMAQSYSAPNARLLQISYQTYWSAFHTRKFRVFEIRCIESVVMMARDVNYPEQDGTENDRWYLMEKPGLKLSPFLDDVEVEDD